MFVLQRLALGRLGAISSGLLKWLDRFSLRNIFQKFRRRKDDPIVQTFRFGQRKIIEVKSIISDFPVADEKPVNGKPVAFEVPAPKPVLAKSPAPAAPPASPSSFTLPRLEFTPVPEILRHLAHRGRADLVLLSDRNGVPLAYCKGVKSQLPQRADLEMIAKLAAGQIAAGHHIAENIGEEGLLDSIFQEGELRNVYISQISAEFILVLLVDKSIVIGLVRIQINEALAKLRKILEGI